MNARNQLLAMERQLTEMYKAKKLPDFSIADLDHAFEELGRLKCQSNRFGTHRCKNTCNACYTRG